MVLTEYHKARIRAITACQQHSRFSGTYHDCVREANNKNNINLIKRMEEKYNKLNLEYGNSDVDSSFSKKIKRSKKSSKRKLKKSSKRKLKKSSKRKSKKLSKKR